MSAQDRPSDYKERMKQLLRWAAYYVACAIINTVMSAKIPERDVSAKISFTNVPTTPAYRRISLKEFNTIYREYQVVEYEYLNQYQLSENPNMQGYAAFAVLAPLVMGSAISVGAFTINLLLKEEKIAS